MTDLETFLAVLVLIWILWPFIAAALIWLIGTSIDFLYRLAP